MAEFWSTFEQQVTHSTKVSLVAGEYFVQIWAHLVKNSTCAFQKTIYVVPLLSKLSERDLWALIAQRSFGSAQSAMQSSKALVLRFLKWCYMPYFGNFKETQDLGQKVQNLQKIKMSKSFRIVQFCKIGPFWKSQDHSFRKLYCTLSWVEWALNYERSKVALSELT